MIEWLNAAKIFVSFCKPHLPPNIIVMNNEIRSPQEVFEHHLSAFGAHDMDSLMSDYTEQSILISPEAKFKGVSEIKAFFEGIMPHFPTEGTSIEIDKMFTEDNILYITWHGSTPSLNVSFATDTFVIENDKIQVQTFAAVMQPIETDS